MAVAAHHQKPSVQSYCLRQQNIGRIVAVNIQIDHRHVRIVPTQHSAQAVAGFVRAAGRLLRRKDYHACRRPDEWDRSGHGAGGLRRILPGDGDSPIQCVWGLGPSNQGRGNQQWTAAVHQPSFQDLVTDSRRRGRPARHHQIRRAGVGRYVVRQPSDIAPPLRGDPSRRLCARGWSVRHDNLLARAERLDSRFCRGLEPGRIRLHVIDQSAHAATGAKVARRHADDDIADIDPDMQKDQMRIEHPRRGDRRLEDRRIGNGPARRHQNCLDHEKILPGRKQLATEGSAVP